MSNTPNYASYHLHELEEALKNLDCEANPEEEKLLKELIANGGYSYPTGQQVSPETKSLVTAQEITNSKFKWTLVGILGVLIFFNLVNLIFTHQLISLIPIIFQSVILTMIFKKNSSLKTFIKVWSVLLIIGGIAGMYLSTQIPEQSALFNALSIIGGVLIFRFSGKYVCDINTSNKSFKPTPESGAV